VRSRVPFQKTGTKETSLAESAGNKEKLLARITRIARFSKKKRLSTDPPANVLYGGQVIRTNRIRE